MQEAGLDFELAMTNGPLQATALAHAAQGRYAGVVAVGGDGTVHEIVNGLVRASQGEPTMPLGVVPLGSGDDFAKLIPPQAAIGGKAQHWQQAIEKLTMARTQAFDVGRMQGWIDQAGRRPVGDAEYFMNGMDVGFGAHGNRNLAKVPRFLKGQAAYMAAVLKTLIDYPVLHLTVQIDEGAPYQFSTTMTAVTNGRCIGGSFWVCPEAKPDDGLLDLMLVQAVGRLTILGLIPKILRGAHAKEATLRMVQAKRLLLQSEGPFAVEADGEMPYDAIRRLEIDLLPGRLTVMV